MPTISGALLNAKWEMADARIAAEVRRRGTLPEGDLTEEEITRIAVEMTAQESGAREVGDERAPASA